MRRGSCGTLMFLLLCGPALASLPDAFASVSTIFQNQVPAAVNAAMQKVRQALAAETWTALHAPSSDLLLWDRMSMVAQREGDSRLSRGFTQSKQLCLTCRARGVGTAGEEGCVCVTWKAFFAGLVSSPPPLPRVQLHPGGYSMKATPSGTVVSVNNCAADDSGADQFVESMLDLWVRRILCWGQVVRTSLTPSPTAALARLAFLSPPWLVSGRLLDQLPHRSV
jgi:hypothetical protein